ncbi:N-acetylmuramoyl-L-alanine amidase [Synechococcus sp. CBW1004]|uniref:N-acetylmuramoyl-L-alanine amidase n=1 Tax=Synechococcus sp. CBW1004 TaxID=1353136 RepID=UPI0018CEBDDD|nr:N-acetylmuramoyl-L-alanine amidase [Synechococcus sp. CBW1004]QPN63223.1 N-acetylmuramoyl-L-alanine amidase [Synechococcus sp. CBW1004]
MIPRFRFGRTGLRTAGRSALLVALLTLLAELPAWAGSSLSAWRFNREGSLEIRTAPGIQVQAFFEEGPPGKGPRVWIDLPGAPSRTRTVPAGGVLREVRIGKPDPGTTRLVLEFQPGTRLDPRQLRLVGTARDRWRMDFQGLPSRSLLAVGEGDFDAPVRSGGWISRNTGSGFGNSGRTTSPLPLNPAGLPSVPRGRYRVVIDPGHGGPDPGAVGIGGLRETNVVLDVGLQVAQLLQARGVSVSLTRTSEVDVDLPPRVALANNIGAHLFVSLHANALSMSRPDVNGVETFYFQGGNSQRLASVIQQQLMAVSPGTPDRGARPGRFYVIRRTTMPSALAEMGFVTGSIDAPRLADPNFRRRLALAVATAILEYLNP